MKIKINLLVAVTFVLCTPLPLLADNSIPATTVTLPTPPAFTEKLATPDLLSKLRKGGYILYIRHGITDNSRPDRVPSVDLNDCNTQRLLSDEGRTLMKRVGRSIKRAKLPISEILVSPMCRTKESAELAFGKNFTLSESLMYSANMTNEEKKPRLEELKKMLLAPIKPGTNRVMLAHAPNLADLIGFFVKPEGTVVVFAQQGPLGYEYVASIPPDLWDTLNK